MQLGKVEKILKEAWIQSHHLHHQWKFELWAGKFAQGVKAEQDNVKKLLKTKSLFTSRSI